MIALISEITLIGTGLSLHVHLLSAQLYWALKGLCMAESLHFQRAKQSKNSVL